MRIAAIADVHGNMPALRAVFADIESTGVRETICLGDLIGYGPFPNEVIQAVREKGVTCVQGNYDEAVGHDRLVCGCDFKNEQDALIGAASIAWTREHTSAAGKEYLRSLPRELFLEFPPHSLHCFHGSPQSQTEYLKMDTAKERLSEIARQSAGDILLFGHTHLPGVIRHGEKYFINAGSVGKPKHGDPRASYILLDLTGRVAVEIRYIAYDMAETLSAMRKAGLPENLITKIESGTA